VLVLVFVAVLVLVFVAVLVLVFVAVPVLVFVFVAVRAVAVGLPSAGVDAAPLVLEEHVDGRRPDPVFHRLADRVADGEPFLDRPEHRGVGTGRDQRGTDHVAGRAGPTVESERTHGGTNAVDG
jgi:hypothetical protein